MVVPVRGLAQELVATGTIVVVVAATGITVVITVVVVIAVGATSQVAERTAGTIGVPVIFRVHPRPLSAAAAPVARARPASAIVPAPMSASRSE